jgi:hypothetical protein
VRPIQLTELAGWMDVRTHGTSEARIAVLVNPDAIAFVRDSGKAEGGATYVSLVSGAHLFVNETPSQVGLLLAQHRHSIRVEERDGVAV